MNWKDMCRYARTISGELCVADGQHQMALWSAGSSDFQI